MKRKIVLALIFLLLFCLVYLIISSRKIEGVWLNTNYISSASGNILPGKSILKLKNHKSNSYSHYNNPSGNGYFFYFKNSIWTWPKFYEIYAIKKASLVYQDSLILELQKGEKNIFKKVHDSLQNNSDYGFSFKNKAFEFRTENTSGKLYFNQELFFIKSNSSSLEWHIDGWEAFKVDNFNFIVFANSSPLIVKKNNSVPLLYQFNNGNSLGEIKLKETSLDSTEFRNIQEQVEAFEKRRNNK